MPITPRKILYLYVYDTIVCGKKSVKSNLGKIFLKSRSGTGYARAYFFVKAKNPCVFFIPANEILWGKSYVISGLSPKNLRIKEGQLIFIDQGINRLHHSSVIAV
jgi:hypothetical protein